MRALVDSGATHTTMGPLGLQIASECGKTLTLVFNITAKMINGNQEEILGKVELPITVAGVRHPMNVFIVKSLGIDCLLGTDFHRIFNAVVHPSENTITIDGVSDSIPLELAIFSTDEAFSLASFGLAIISDAQREEINPFRPKMSIFAHQIQALQFHARS